MSKEKRVFTECKDYKTIMAGGYEKGSVNTLDDLRAFVHVNLLTKKDLGEEGIVLGGTGVNKESIYKAIKALGSDYKKWRTHV